MSAAALTVLLPLKHFHATYLQPALDSTRRQTCPAWQGLVIADGQNVPTFAELLAADPVDRRISLIANEGRQLAGKLNTGMRHAPSSFAAILLGDVPSSMAEYGATFMANHEPLYRARDHRDGFRLTTDLPRSVHIREIRRIMQKHRGSWGGRPAEDFARQGLILEGVPLPLRARPMGEAALR